MSKVMRLKGLKRGYVVTLKTKVFNFGEGKHKYDVYELSGPKMDKPRFFVDEDSVRMFVNSNETDASLSKSFENAVKRATSKSERKEMLAAKELETITNVDIAAHIDASMRDNGAKRPSELG